MADSGELGLRTPLRDDAELLVEATRGSRPEPCGVRGQQVLLVGRRQDGAPALDPAEGKHASYGVLRAEWLVAALG